jgi:hypothetical protein
VFKAAPLGLVRAEVRSVARTGRSWAMSGPVAVRPQKVPPTVVPVAVLGVPARLTAVVICSGERKED